MRTDHVCFSRSSRQARRDARVFSAALLKGHVLLCAEARFVNGRSPMTRSEAAVRLPGANAQSAWGVALSKRLREA